MGSSPELTLTMPGNTDCKLPYLGAKEVMADSIKASSLNAMDDRSNNPPYNLSTTPDNMAGPFNAPKKKTSKHKFNILGRKQSLKDDDPQPIDLRLGSSSKSKPPKTFHREPKTEKPARERPSAVRNRSLERQIQTDDGFVHPGSSTNGQHSSIQQSVRSTSTRAADGFGRAAKGLLGKLSNRTHPVDSHSSDRSRNEAEAQKAAITKSYKVVNLPLDEQTRMTRICKRLEDCKDKTEFWLPAVAYRCIDYLNDKGMTHEGLYRVPGSEREIRNWIWRFDNGEIVTDCWRPSILMLLSQKWTLIC
jgi:RhoGAP domain